METVRMTLSQRERDRLRVLHQVEQGQLAQIEAARRMKLTDRQVRRLLCGLRERGDRVVIHGLRGRPSNRKLAVRLEQKIWRGCTNVMRISDLRWPPNTWPRRVSP
jgi:predicted ArsR family transcriptional regulator